MKNLCIIPFTEKEYPLLDHLSNDYSVSALVSPKGIGFEGEDVSILRNTSPCGFHFTNSMEQGIGKSDIVLISQIAPEQKELYLYALNALRYAARSGKKIICCLEITASEKEQIKQLCDHSGADFELWNDPDEISVDQSKFRLNQFDVPVFYVAELIPGCDGYDVFLKIANWFRKNGKNVLAISEDCYNPLMGFESVKFGAKLEVKDQIFRINQLIYELVQKKQPEIILIRLSQPMMKYNEANPFDCGGTAFLVSQAVEGAGCIFCSQAHSLTGDLWEEINEGVSSKFGYPILGIHISNQLVDSTGGADLSFIRIPYNEVESEVNRLNQTCELPFYRLLEENDLKTLCGQLENENFNLPYGVI